MRSNTLNLCTGFLIVGLVSACGSGDDNTTPMNPQEPVTADSSSSGGTESTSTETVLADTSPVVSETGETDAVTTQIDSQTSDDESTDTTTANPQNDGEPANTEALQPQENPDEQDTDTEQPPTDNQRVSFGNANLLVDLVANGDSYPAKFHRAGDKLYFWTVDTNPRFADCSWHWGWLGDEDKNVALSLVATHPQTGVVAMNKKIMTVGDFTDDPNDACAGYNGSIMQVFEQTWVTPPSTAGGQQFALHFDSFLLGPDQLWNTDGSEPNTTQLATGGTREQATFVGDKVFFVSEDGLSVADSLAGERRKLYEIDESSYAYITLIEKSPARQATFEITLRQNSSQIWTYDLDTDDWEKKFSIKPDGNTYNHHRTLLVNDDTLLSLGESAVDFRSTLAYSNNYGDVTSFEILSGVPPTIPFAELPGTLYNPNNSDRLYYIAADYSAEIPIMSIWVYRDRRIEKLFTISEPGLNNTRVIDGHDGRIYVAATKPVGEWPESSLEFKLWSYNPPTGQLVKLSKDDWYAIKHNHPTPDQDYVFRYLNTSDGLVFVNLKDDTGREPWFTDGTPEGTRLLSDINPGPGNSDPQNFHHSGDALYFSANDGTHGHEPWTVPISR